MGKCVDLEIAASIVCEMCEGFYPNEACRKEECEWIKELHAHAVRDDAPKRGRMEKENAALQLLREQLQERDRLLAELTKKLYRAAYGEAKDGT